MKDKPAFPRFYSTTDKDDQGMTLREYYAGCALQGLCADMTSAAKVIQSVWHPEATADTEPYVARLAFLLADSMISQTNDS